SKVWNWYDILPDGYRQCRFCPQKYGNLTATTILARHYHNRHEMDESASGTPSHRGSAATVRSSRNNSVHTPTHQQISLQQSNQSVYSQAAAAAAAVAAAAVTANGESAYAHSALAGNGTATEDLLRSVSEAVQNSPYEENQIIMQDGFQTMMTTPLTRISLTPARRAVAAVAQFCAQNDMQKNLQTCVDLVSTAARRGAKMVFLPEASDFIAETRMQPAQQAQGLDGQFMKEMQQAAKDNGIWISVGIHEQPPVNGMPYNTNAVISDDGSLVSIYRKLHLFDVNVKDGPRLSESSVTSRGEQIVDPVDTPVGRLGLSVCYDLRFPELAQRLRMRGAQLLCYPSAFTETTGAPHWEVLLRARAIETQTYVFAAAQVGKHNPKRSSYGDAMIVDPWGSVVARCSRNSSEPALATAEINLDFLDKVRRESPVFSHKRADVFSEYAS
ncbi:Carbon-nitrogen hydrolase, partial [Dipsacomyces acuminosporus]